MTYSAASSPRAFPAHRTVYINSSFQWKNILPFLSAEKNECLESAMRNYNMSQYALILQNILETPSNAVERMMRISMSAFGSCFHFYSTNAN